MRARLETGAQRGPGRETGREPEREPGREAPVGECRQGLAPIIGGQPRLLILGSMPGLASLRQQQYYGHPRNAFWPIMCHLLGLPAAADYARRTRALVAHGIALWDVIAACERQGSLDQAIRPDSIQVNDFVALFAAWPGIARIAFNGATAEREFQRRVLPLLAPAQQRLPRLRLPSTSPAHAARTLAEKLAAWRVILPALADTDAGGND
ncbi:MAG: DNA-deoxyinosine glycosylase [Chromatiaceae bacterium]|nr:MAG: DNA-deoxyinosine glycosylase [Chromatiaceae bacterium]